MREGSGIDAQRRALNVAASTILVALACYALVLASRTSAPYDISASGVEVILAERERPRATPRTPRPRIGAPTPSRDAAADARTIADRAALARALACFGPRERRPRSCPREAAPREGMSGRLPAGGDFYEPPAIDRNRIYTPAELDTLVMPPCEAGCIPVGPPPPPPSRSAEQICRDANMGGPCEPPPFRAEDVVRRRHTN